MRQEHRNEKSSPGRGGGAGQRELVTLCQLPFVLSPEAKARIMQGEALLTKQHQVQASAIQVSWHAVPLHLISSVYDSPVQEDTCVCHCQEAQNHVAMLL